MNGFLIYNCFEFAWQKLKSKMTNNNFIIHILSSIFEEYDIILDGLENCQTSSGSDAHMIELICENEKVTKKERKN